eukprot:1712113-Rhodomonas_salina.1
MAAVTCGTEIAYGSGARARGPFATPSSTSDAAPRSEVCPPPNQMQSPRSAVRFVLQNGLCPLISQRASISASALREYAATPCALLPKAMLLHDVRVWWYQATLLCCYAMCGTEIGYGGTGDWLPVDSLEQLFAQ